MTKKKNTTILITKEETHPLRKWFLLDASGKTLGRFAAEVAKILRGKHKTCFTPHVDTGDGVVIINAEKIVVTGAKQAQKIYRYHTGAMSGMREVPYRSDAAPQTRLYHPPCSEGNDAEDTIVRSSDEETAHLRWR